MKKNRRREKVFLLACLIMSMATMPVQAGLEAADTVLSNTVETEPEAETETEIETAEIETETTEAAAETEAETEAETKAETEAATETEDTAAATEAATEHETGKETKPKEETETESSSGDVTLDNILADRFEQPAEAMIEETLVDGVIEVGKGQTVAGALEDLTVEQVEEADGEITICLTGPTDDTSDIFLPLDKGLTQVTLTSSDGEDYGIGSKASGTVKPVSLFANGISFVWEHGKITNLYGGGKDIRLDSTSITIRGGKLYGTVSGDKGNIVGGSLATKKGADVSIEGDCSIRIEGVDDFSISSMYAGCFTDTGDVTAAIGSTHIVIDESKLSVAIMAGGSYIWGAPTKNVTLDLQSSNIEITDSIITNGYMDLTFSIFGGHMGNDEVTDVIMNCDSVDISVVNSKIIPEDDGCGGEIFGGSYDIKGDRENTDEITVGDVEINLDNSEVNGVWGGGCYENPASVQTGSVSIMAENCTFNPSSAINIPVICGGDLYYNQDMYPIPQIDNTSITLTGKTKTDAGKMLLISAEGLADDMPKGEAGSIYPDESHLTLNEAAANQLAGTEAILTADSKWTDVTLLFDSERTAKITDFEDYADLIDQVEVSIRRDAMLDAIPDDIPGKVENDLEVDQIETPDLPSGVEVAASEIQTQKEAALGDTVAQLSKAAAKNTDTGLKEAIEELDDVFARMQAGDSLNLYLNMELSDIKLKAKREGAGIVLVPQKMTIDISPRVSLMDSGGTEKLCQKVDNTSLNGGSINFVVGFPSGVTEKYVNITHHISAGLTREFQEEILAAADGSRYVELSANSFSLFEFEFTDTLAGETVAPASKSRGTTKDRPGQWRRDEKGWRYEAGYNNWLSSGWNYLYYNGTYKWYLFDANGYMMTGGIQRKTEAVIIYIHTQMAIRE